MPDHTTPSPTDRWFTLLAPLAAFVAPVTTARRADRARLWWAWIVHLLGLAILMAVIALLDACSGADHPASLAEVLGGWWASLVESIVWAAVEERRAFLIGMLVIECMALMLGLLLMAWGAGDESPNRAVVRSHRRVFLFTPHVALLVLLVGLLSVGLGRVHDRYWQPFYDSHHYPAYPASADAAWRDAYNQHEAAQPAILKWRFAITSVATFAAIAWGVLTLLCAAAVRPDPPRCVWPPICEACGYTLAGVVNQSTCPECGVATQLSLDPATRPGSPWERRKEIGRAAAWLQTCLLGVFHPHRLASQLRLWSAAPGNDHRRFLLLNTGLITLLSAASFFGIHAVDRWRYDEPYWNESLLSSVGFAYAVGIAALVLAIFNACVLGVGTRRPDKRAMLAGAMQAASYASGFLILWCALLWAQVGLFSVVDFALEELLRDPARRLGVHPDALVAIFVLGPHAVCLIVYTVLVGQITRKLVHVNR